VESLLLADERSPSVGGAGPAGPFAEPRPCRAGVGGRAEAGPSQRRGHEWREKRLSPAAPPSDRPRSNRTSRWRPSVLFLLKGRQDL